MVYKCPKCGKAYDNVDFKTFKCSKCGYKAVQNNTKLEFKKYYNKVAIITTQIVLKNKKEALRELEEGIATEEENIEISKSNIKYLRKGRNLSRVFNIK